MKIAISAVNHYLDVLIDEDLISTTYYIIVDTDNVLDYNYYKNPFCQSTGNPAIHIVNFLLRRDVDVVVTKHCTRDIIDLFNDENVEVLLVQDKTVREAVKEIIHNEKTNVVDLPDTEEEIVEMPDITDDYDIVP